MCENIGIYIKYATIFSMPKKTTDETKIQSTVIKTRGIIYAVPFDAIAARESLLEAQRALLTETGTDQIKNIFSALAGLAAEASIVATAFQNNEAKETFSAMNTEYQNQLTQIEQTKQPTLQQRNTGGRKG